MEISPEIAEKLKLLKDKYEHMGQDMTSYLDGLLHSDYLKYWDYIHLDVLLNLQTPKTAFEDEYTFIMYHQITELYFKLVQLAQKALMEIDQPSVEDFDKYFKRINNYFNHLIDSFDIMIDGMEKESFLKFRMALLPASGFQSAQYRMIELRSADVHNLVHWTEREALKNNNDPEILLENLYWKKGGRTLDSGEKTLTLRQFEEKYNEQFLDIIEKNLQSNIWKQYKKLSDTDQKDKIVVDHLRAFDQSANVRWPLVHMRSAGRYLQKKPKEIAATGGTNWQKYLPPANQRVIFFPELWTDEAMENWGNMKI